MRLELYPGLEAISPEAWDALLATQQRPTPFMRHAWLHALHSSGCASGATGWQPQVFALWAGSALVGACVVYLKNHSWGEYVFDHAWARAYQHHGLPYYPKAVIAVPFTPVPGSRLLARDMACREHLLAAVLEWCREQGMSSLHLLLGDTQDMACAQALGLVQRDQLQFHWHNSQPPYPDFDAFLAALTQDKRKKIRQERRKVAQAGVRWRVLQGKEIAPQDWDFFFRCYARTYHAHGNPPYLNTRFFQQVGTTLPEHWVMFVAERNGHSIATSLIAVDAYFTRANGQFSLESEAGAATRHAYGRYWGALETLDCLHFEACYYQPLQWCIQHGIAHFEGGAQGEHKMARALLPTLAHSAHWIAHPAFAQAVDGFLQQEREAVQEHQHLLSCHTPLRKAQEKTP